MIPIIYGVVTPLWYNTLLYRIIRTPFRPSTNHTTTTGARDAPAPRASVLFSFILIRTTILKIDYI